jgi:hypothetical protein
VPQRWPFIAAFLLVCQQTCPAAAGDSLPFDITSRGAIGAIAFMAPAANGGFALVGWRQPQKGWRVIAGETGGSATWMMRLDSSGKTLWEKDFSTTERGPATFAAPLPDGGFISAGWTNSTAARPVSAWGMRVNGQGETLWSKTFFVGKHDQAELALAPDGGFVALGKIDGKDAEDGSIWTMRVDGRGEIVWNKSLGSSNDPLAPSINALSDGGLAIVGRLNPPMNGLTWAKRLDSQGNQTGDWRFGSSELETRMEFAAAPPDGGLIVASQYGELERLGSPGATSWEVGLCGCDLGSGAIQALPDGGFIATGPGHTHRSLQSNRGPAYIARVSPDGALMWSETYGRFQESETIDLGYEPAADAEVRALAALPGGDFISVGSTNLREGGETNAWVLRINHSGVLLWDKTFGANTPANRLTAVLPASGDGVLASGQIQLPGAASLSAWVLRLDGEGVPRWQAAIRDATNEPAQNTIKSVLSMPDGGFAIAGGSQPEPTGKTSSKTTVWAIRLDAAGSVLWQWPR